MRIPVGRNHFAEIDDEDLPLVLPYKWILHTTKTARSTNFYAVAIERIDGATKSIYMHRLILGAAKGSYVDHIDHDGLNNRKSNLRKCSNSQNMANSRWPVGKSGFRGVSSGRKEGTWRASISVDGKQKFLGHRGTPEEAACLYDAAAIAYFGEFAVTNFKGA